MERIENPQLMHPMLPDESNRRLGDLAVELVACTSMLAGKVAKETIEVVSGLVRSMNCYYSNLIEGHNTHPIDIEQALKGNYSSDPVRRNLQLEAFAHIEVQSLIDNSQLGYKEIVSRDYIIWLHNEFCKRLPQELLENRDIESSKIARAVPGELRSIEVVVGQHLAPVASELPRFLDLFETSYNSDSLSKIMKIIAVAASHHRLLWIHPFLDGNGRVTRLFSHSFLKSIGIGSGLWSVSRGLARSVQEYKERLSAADGWRESDTDGRGSLSLRRLNEFCEFFLSTCIDQVKFMDSLLEPTHLVERVRRYMQAEIDNKKLPKGSFELVRELILAGTVSRVHVPSITGYKERQSRTITSALIDRGLVFASSPRENLKLQIPQEVVSEWFPRLYP
jgi:Fic family protein